MSGKNKKHNSIIFLTTLSVYLSLSLLGAAPQVLAYAATTRDFDVQTEIEYKDDLDNKPDGNPLFQDIDLSSAVTNLLKDLKKYREENPELYGKNKSFYKTRERIVYHDNSSEIKTSNVVVPNDFHKSFENFFNSLDSAQLRSLADLSQEKTSGKASKSIVFEAYPSVDLALKLSISFKKDSAEKASYLVNLLNLEFAYRSTKLNQNLLNKKVYENTKAISQNNQVFIVTRLPRAGIDALIQ